MTTAYAYETSSNRLTGETGARVRDYLYDPLGNITADGVHEYIYDLRNRLVSIDNGDVGHYLIGPLGERLWKKGIIPGQAVFDPNGDGVIDKEDLIAVRAARKAFRKYGTFTPEADCTGDGIVIDKADSVCMRQRLRYQRKTTRWSEKTAILSAMLVGKSPDCTGDGVVDEADKICVKEKVRNARPRRNHIPVIDLAGDCTGDGLLNRDDRICVRRYINISARLVKIAAKVTELETWAASLPYPVTGGGGATQDEEEILFFAYDVDGALIGEYDANGAPVRETIRLAGLPVGVISNGVTYRIHPDHLGSPRAITDDVDKVIWRWTGLNPFGLDSADSDPDGDGTKFTFNQRFPGQYFDGESGFHYNYYRDFSPSTGRYVQSDPIGLSGGLNTFAYVEGNPLSFSDPLGLAMMWECQTRPFSCMTEGGGGGGYFSAGPTGPNPLASKGNTCSSPAANEVGILRDAAKGKGNFGLGSVTHAEADRLGQAWVGNGAKLSSDGKTWVSQDGFRQYRAPSFKPNLGKVQANFEQRFPGQRTRRWQSNGHLDIAD